MLPPAHPSLSVNSRDLEWRKGAPCLANRAGRVGGVEEHASIRVRLYRWHFKAARSGRSMATRDVLRPCRHDSLVSGGSQTRYQRLTCSYSSGGRGLWLVGRVYYIEFALRGGYLGPSGVSRSVQSTLPGSAAHRCYYSSTPKWGNVVVGEI